MQSYQRPTNWAIRSWGTFNRRLLPAFPAGWTTTSFRRRSSPGQIKHLAATWRNSTSFQFTSQTTLEMVSVEVVGLVMEVCMPGYPVCQTWHPLISTCGDMWRTWCISRNCRHKGNFYGASWMVLVLEQSWEHTESNMCCLKMSWLVRSQCKR
jgi:hypothetical protein